MINKGVPVIDQLLKMFDFPQLELLVKEMAQTNMLNPVLFIFKKSKKIIYLSIILRQAEQMIRALQKPKILTTDQLQLPHFKCFVHFAVFHSMNFVFSKQVYFKKSKIYSEKFILNIFLLYNNFCFRNLFQFCLTSCEFYCFLNVF